MSHRILVATFEREHDLIDFAKASRERGIRLVDIYTPYPVHGLDRAMGLAPSRLTWVCFGLGAAGALFMLWLQFWTSAVSWPINVGGKPWNSLPAFVPVTFEMMVLFAGVGTFFALLGACRLWPGKEAVLPAPRITEDRFAVVLEETGPVFDPAEVRRLMERFHAVTVEERVV